jgi:hypothetical protein
VSHGPPPRPMCPPGQARCGPTLLVGEGKPQALSSPLRPTAAAPRRSALLARPTGRRQGAMGHDRRTIASRRKELRLAEGGRVPPRACTAATGERSPAGRLDDTRERKGLDQRFLARTAVGSQPVVQVQRPGHHENPCLAHRHERSDQFCAIIFREQAGPLLEFQQRAPLVQLLP